MKQIKQALKIENCVVQHCTGCTLIITRLHRFSTREPSRSSGHRFCYRRVYCGTEGSNDYAVIR